MDLLQGIQIVGEMVGELELELVSDLGQSFCGKPWAKAQLCSAMEIRFLVIRKVVIAMNSLWYFPKSVSDEIPTLEASPTSFSISPIDQHLSASNPRYNLYTVSTNF